MQSFMALASNGTSQKDGDVYATHSVYSGGLLMHTGYLQNMIFGDYGSAMLHFVKDTAD